MCVRCMHILYIYIPFVQCAEVYMLCVCIVLLAILVLLMHICICISGVRDPALSRWALGFSLVDNSGLEVRALASRILSHLSLSSESVKRYALNLGLSLATPGRNKGSSMSDWWTRLFHPLIQFTTIKVGISKLCPLKRA